jgi:hypothetical protein
VRKNVARTTNKPISAAEWLQSVKMEPCRCTLPKVMHGCTQSGCYRAATSSRQLSAQLTFPAELLLLIWHCLESICGQHAWSEGVQKEWLVKQARLTESF